MSDGTDPRHTPGGGLIAEPTPDWDDMSTEQKIRHIMWRFVGHPKYTDDDNWNLKLVWNMDKWYLFIGKGKSFEFTWSCGTVDEVPSMLSKAHDVIEKEIAEAEEPEGWKALLERVERLERFDRDRKNTLENYDDRFQAILQRIERLESKNDASKDPLTGSGHR